MMGDNSLSEHPSPMEFLNVHLGDNLQPHPGVHPRGACSHLDSPEPLREQTWAPDPPESVRRDVPPGGCGAEPAGLGDGFSQRNPGPSRSTSAQVVFWAGILQAQMCVLDLEEELEKTEGLRAELRSCLPMAPAALPPFSSQGSPLDTGPLPSPPAGVALGEDSSGPEGEGQDAVRPAEGTPGSSLESGAEDEGMFFDNPLFLESSHSDSASAPHFSWGLPDTCTDVRPESPQTLQPPLQREGMPWGLGDEPDSGDGSAGSSGCTTPPFPVPIYQPHCWAPVATTDRPPTTPRGLGDGEVSQALGTDLELSLETSEDGPCSVVTGPGHPSDARVHGSPGIR